MTTMRQLIEALADGQSLTVKKMERVFNDEALPIWKQPHYPAITAEHHFDVLDQACIDVLGFDEKEIEHVNGWPNEVKEAVRRSAIAAVAAGKRVQFRWGLSRDAAAEDVEQSDSAATYTARFVEPYHHVHIDEATGQMRIGSQTEWERFIARQQDEMRAHQEEVTVKPPM